MALAVDDTTVARFTGTPTNGNPITSGSFAPPNNSFLVVKVNADTGGSADITISVSGGSLTWLNEVERDKGDAGAEAGHASIWTAEVGTGASMTVDVTRTAGDGGTNRISAKVYIVTGQDQDDPVGAVGEGSGTANQITPTGYASTVNNSRGMACATDWNQNGLPTSADVEDAADYTGQISVLSVYKSADTPTSGTNVTFDFDAAGAGAAAWNWVAIEIKPAAGATATISVGGTITPAGSLTKQVGKLLGGTITPTGSLSKLASKLFSGTITPVGALTKQVAKLFSGLITPTGSLLKQVNKFFAGAIALVGSLLVQALGELVEISISVSETPVTRANLSVESVGQANIAVESVNHANVSVAPATLANLSVAPVTRATITVELVGG